MRAIPFGLAFSAVAVSAFYLLLAGWLHRLQRPNLRLLVEAFLALAIAFATLALPLAFEGRWTAAAWALEGAAILWVGLRQQRLLARICGTLLQVAAGAAFLFDIRELDNSWPILNSLFLGALMLSLAGLFSGWILYRMRENLRGFEAPLSLLLFYWGLVWWLVGGLTELEEYVASQYFLASALAFFALTASLLTRAATQWQWPTPRVPALWLLPVMIAIAAVMAVDGGAHPLANGGYLAWPLAFAAFYFTLRTHELALSARLRAASHATGLWLFAALASWEIVWVIDHMVAGAGSWPLIAWAVVPAALLFLMPRAVQRLAWPFGAHPQTYLGIAGAGLAAYLLLWSLATNRGATGDPAPLPYLPLLNPLDVAQALALLAIAFWFMRARAWPVSFVASMDRKLVIAPLGLAVFVWLNAILLRTLHHWANVPFDLDTMLGTTLVQTSLSLMWILLALAIMLISTRRGSRPLWFVGAALMGVVVVKLFVVDLSSIGTVERIVSFIAVGLLMLVVGYFSPLPPAVVEKEQ